MESQMKCNEHITSKKDIVLVFDKYEDILTSEEINSYLNVQKTYQNSKYITIHLLFLTYLPFSKCFIDNELFPIFFYPLNKQALEHICLSSLNINSIKILKQEKIDIIKHCIEYLYYLNPSRLFLLTVCFNVFDYIKNLNELSLLLLL